MKNGQKRKPWTPELERALRVHSKQRTPVATIAKVMRRTPGALRQKALMLEIGLGHRR